MSGIVTNSTYGAAAQPLKFGSSENQEKKGMTLLGAAAATGTAAAAGYASSALRGGIKEEKVVEKTKEKMAEMGKQLVALADKDEKVEASKLTEAQKAYVGIGTDVKSDVDVTDKVKAAANEFREAPENPLQKMIDELSAEMKKEGADLDKIVGDIDATKDPIKSAVAKALTTTDGESKTILLADDKMYDAAKDAAAGVANQAAADAATKTAVNSTASEADKKAATELKDKTEKFVKDSENAKKAAADIEEAKKGAPNAAEIAKKVTGEKGKVADKLAGREKVINDMAADAYKQLKSGRNWVYTGIAATAGLAVYAGAKAFLGKNDTTAV